MGEKPILMILTGGTICSVLNDREETQSDADRTVTLLENRLKDGGAFWQGVTFVREKPVDMLSENMTIGSWNRLIGYLKTVDWHRYRGAIVLHGTDTLAYGSSLLAVLLAGIAVPVCLVSGNYRLDDPRTNGHANFACAVDLILGGMQPGVYVPYRNDDGTMWVHRGAHLEQCRPQSINFHSATAMTAQQALDQTGCPSRGRPLIGDLVQLQDWVLQISPYVGINYSRFGLEGVRAVVHGVYHSSTACVGTSTDDQPDDAPHSVLHLIRRCRQQGIDLFLAPVPGDFDDRQEHNLYSSTGIMCRQGALLLRGMTWEMATVKTLIACALYEDRSKRLQFLEGDVCGETMSRR